MVRTMYNTRYIRRRGKREMGSQVQVRWKPRFKSGAILFGILALVLSVFPSYAVNAALSSSSLGLGDSRPGQTAQYTLTSSGFDTGATIGCIEVDMGTAVDGTGSVSGLSTAASTFVSQTITAT